MRKRKLIAFFHIILILIAGFWNLRAQENEKLEDKRITMHMKSRSFGHILGTLIVDYNVPFGFEESTLDRNEPWYFFETNLPGDPKKGRSGKEQYLEQVEQDFPPPIPITIDVNNQRLETVLNLLVHQMPNYKWEIADGVVNILPIKGRDEIFQALLMLKIRDFELRKPFIWSMKNDICALPEFKTFMFEHGLSFSKGHSDSVDSLRRQLPEKIRFADLTLKELLNKLSRIKGGGWILKHQDFPNVAKGLDIEI